MLFIKLLILLNNYYYMPSWYSLSTTSINWESTPLQYAEQSWPDLTVFSITFLSFLGMLLISLRTLSIIGHINLSIFPSILGFVITFFFLHVFGFAGWHCHLMSNSLNSTMVISLLWQWIWMYSRNGSVSETPLDAEIWSFFDSAPPLKDWWDFIEFNSPPPGKKLTHLLVFNQVLAVLISK